MAKLSLKVGSTSVTVNLFIQDSTSTTGAGKTGLAFNTAALTAYYSLPKAAAAAITLATQTVTGAWSSGGFVEIDATNMPGWYRFDIPNAAIASGIFSSIHLKGATGMAPLPLEIELTAWDNQDATAGGLSRLDAAVTSRMATYTQPTGFLAATFPTGTVANTTNITAATGITVSTNSDKTGYSLTQTFPTNFSAMAITAGGVVSASGNWSIAGDAMTLTAAYNAAKTASQAGDAMALTGGERTSLAGVINTTAITESYRANGAAPTPAQVYCEILAHLGESSITGTTKTAKKFDHSTTAATYTLDSGTTPTSVTRAT